MYVIICRIKWFEVKHLARKSHAYPHCHYMLSEPIKAVYVHAFVLGDSLLLLLDTSESRLNFVVLNLSFVTLKFTSGIFS